MGLGWKSLKGVILRALLCGANNMIWFYKDNDNKDRKLYLIITITIIIIITIKPEGRQLRKQCWQEQDLRWPEKDLIVLQNKSNPKKFTFEKKKQARKPRSYASSKLQPTHWRGWSVELLA